MQGREVAPALAYSDLKLVMEAPQAVVLIVVSIHMFSPTLYFPHPHSLCLNLSLNPPFLTDPV